MSNRITRQPFCQTRVSGSTFVNADCFDAFPFIEDKSIDAIIADLPYGTTACKWDSVLPFDKLWEQYNRIIKPAYRDWETDRKSTRLNSSHRSLSRMPSSA